MPVFLTLGLWTLYKTDTSKTLLLLCLTGLTLWLEYSLAFWLGGGNFGASEELLIVGGAWLLLLANTGRYLQALNDQRAKEYGLLLELWCLRLGLIGLLILGFEDPWEGLISADWYHLAPMLFITLIFAGASLWLAIKGGSISWTITLQGIFLVSLALVVMSHDRELAVMLQVIYNLLAVGLGIWLIHRALGLGISHYFFLGIALILFTALLRYADLIGDYIGGAVLFAVCAGVLIGSAKFWRQQQDQLKSESL